MNRLRLFRQLRSRTVYIFVVGLVTWLLAGAGFYFLEPTVDGYIDGLWLAFTTGATVGYGDFVPTTLASRIFAVLMVLLGFAILSVATAAIAALFVGQDEQALERELHRDIRSLREELAALRAELREQRKSDAEQKS
jgi:voltage-gated potassium channel